MPEFNIMEHVDEAGKFGEGFKDVAIAIAGDEHKGTKVYDDVPDFSTLVKNYADTKSLVGKRLENTIQLPAEDASDEDKAVAIKAAQKFLGATENADDYEFPHADGLEYNEQSDANEKTFREFFMSRGVSPALAKELVEMSNQAQVAGVKARLEAETAAFETECKEFDADHPGDSKVEKCQIAFNALMEFGDEDLTSLLKNAKIRDDVGNLDKWNKAGVSPTQLRYWERIGEKMKSPEPPGSEEPGSKEEPEGTSGNDLVGPGKFYDHPTSKELAPKKT